MPYKFKEDNAKRTRRYSKNNRKKCNDILKKYKRKLRRKIIKGYGGKCVKCGFDDERALQIDHVYGGGTKERKSLSNYQILLRIQKENFPSRYQILCANCNCIKRFENKE